MNYLELIKEKGLDEVPYQKNFLIDEKYNDPKAPIVLAVGTGGGKTYTSIMKLDMFYANPENAKKITLVLAAGSRVLRTNFTDSLEKYGKTNFKAKEVANKTEFEQAIADGFNVIVCIDQSIKGLKSFPEVTWVVVDEAHKRYFAKNIQRIIRRTKAKYQLLLTGTPFKFNMENMKNKDSYLMYYTSVEELRKYGRVGNPMIKVVSTSYNHRDADYHPNRMIREDLPRTYKQTKTSLINVGKEIIKDLKEPLKRYTTQKSILNVFGQVGKTIIVAYNGKEAKLLKRAFNQTDLNGQVLVSTHKDDTDSIEFERFEKDDNAKILIVVNRGREGFDMPELMNVVDFSLSTNPEVILQIMGRVLRISKNNPNQLKQYYKVAASNDVGYIKTLMGGILQLTTTEYYSTFTGEIKEVRIPVIPTEPRERQPRNPENREQRLDVRALAWFERVGVPLQVDFWSEVKHTGSELFKTIAYVKLDDVFKAHYNKGGFSDNAITIERVAESAAKYNTTKEWREGDISLYMVSHKHNWFDEVTTHFTDTGWTKSKVKEIANKYTSYTKFKKEQRKAFRAAMYNGWMDLFDHMSTRFEYNWTPEKVFNKVNAAIENGVPNISQFIRQNQSLWRRGVKPLNIEDQVRSMFTK